MTRLRHTWPPLALTLLALAARLHNLTYHSLWFDEAMSVHWARSSVPRILEVSMNLVEDRLPPLYYLVLHYWRLVAGDGEVAVRLPSALLGALLIPVIYRLCADLFGDRRVALLAAALAAFNPFLVWYSQEARMYAQAALLGTLGTWLFLRATQARDTIRPSLYWLGYGLCALAGLYTHLYTGFLLIGHALYLLSTRGRSRRAWVPFILAMLMVAGFFSPLALATWRASSEAGPGDPLAGFGARTWWLLSAFTIWKAPLPPALRILIPAGAAMLAVLGLLLPHRRLSLNSTRIYRIDRISIFLSCRSRISLSDSSAPPSAPWTPRAGRKGSSQLLITLMLLTPFTIATLLLFRNRVAFFGERYFIIMVPWLLISIAAGAIGLADHIRAVTCYLLLATCYLLPIALTLLPLPGLWSPPARKEAWRETVDYLATHARPEDAILIHPDWTRYPLQYYFQGPGQTYAVFGSVEEGTDLDTPLTVISRHPVVWLIEAHTELADPQHQVQAWLAARYPSVTGLYPPGLAGVHGYAPGYLSQKLPDFAMPITADFEGGLRLAGYVVPQTRVQARDDLFHPPSGWIHVTLFWSALAPIGQNYLPFVHLIDDLGQVWGAALERPDDAFDFYPPTRWEPGQTIRADLDVNLNPVTPPGRYMLVVGLRDASGVQVPLTDGSPQAPLTAVEIVN